MLSYFLFATNTLDGELIIDVFNRVECSQY